VALQHLFHWLDFGACQARRVMACIMPVGSGEQMFGEEQQVLLGGEATKKQNRVRSQQQDRRT